MVTVGDNPYYQPQPNSTASSSGTNQDLTQPNSNQTTQQAQSGDNKPGLSPVAQAGVAVGVGAVICCLSGLCCGGGSNSASSYNHANGEEVGAREELQRQRDSGAIP
jgi:hypothetical protein